MAQLEPQRQPYARDTVLTKLFGNNPKTKILAALLSEDMHDHSITDIAGLAGVHRTTVYDHIRDLEDTGVVVKTRDVGDSRMYQIDRDNKAAKQLKRLEDTLFAEYGEE